MSVETNARMTERDKQREQTRRNVYEAALTIFRRDGVEQSRIDDIAKLAGVSRGTFYFHFPTKDDVLAELMLASERRLADKLDDVPHDAPLADVLYLVADHMAEEFQDDPEVLTGLGMAVLRMVGQGIPRMREGHPARIALIPRMQRATELGELEGGIVPPELTTEFLLMNLFGAALTWCGAPILPLGEMLRHVVTYFLRATTPR